MRARFFICVAMTLAVSGWLAAPVTAAPGAHPGHAGRWITDARGRVLDLHGVNMAYKRAPYLSSRSEPRSGSPALG